MDNFDEMFIEEVRKCEGLYNQSRQEYRNKDYKRNCWENISEKMGMSGSTT